MKHHSGRFEIVCGSMFSGKTEELIRRVRRAVIAKQAVQVFKPQIDIRYGIEVVKSHNGQNIEAMPVASPQAIFEHLKPETTVVAIDEIQFFQDGIVNVVQALANRGLRVIAAGLDTDFRGEPFGSMPYLLSIAEEVLKLHAICVVCGDLACRTQRLVNDEPAYYEDPIIMVGAQESYEARCRAHHCIPHRQPATQT